MADVVIVAGVTRGRSMIPCSEIKQMCVGLGTPVFISGEKTFSKKASEVIVGDMVVGVNEKTRKTVGGMVTRVFSRKGNAKRVFLCNGADVVFGNHPVMLWDGTWVSSDELRVGDKVCVVASSDHQSGILSLREKIESILGKTGCYCRVYGEDLISLKNRNVKELAKLCGIEDKSVYKMKKTGVMKIETALAAGFSVRYLRSKNGSEMDLESLNYKELPWALGLIASDGNVRCEKECTLFRVKLRDRSMVERFSSIFRESGFGNARVVHRPVCGKSYWECCVSSFAFVTVLVALGITPNKSRVLDLSAFLELNRKDKLGFLSGFVDGDGNFDGKNCRVRICTASKTAAYNMRNMFLSSGIYATVGKFSGNGHVFGYSCDTTHYVVTVAKKGDVIRFSEECGLSFKIPTSIRTARATRPLIGDCFYTRVKRIEDMGNQDLINFSVAGLETFICDGIVTHNCGRAGRVHGGRKSMAFVLSDVENVEAVEAGLVSDAGLDISSKLHGAESVGFHVLPLFCSGSIVDKAGIDAWFARSWSAFNGGKVDADKVIAYLVESGALVDEAGVLAVTDVGRAAAAFYFPPDHIAAWREGFSILFDTGNQDSDAGMAWAMGLAPVSAVLDERFIPMIATAREMLPPDIGLVKGNVLSYSLWCAAIGLFPAGQMRSVVTVMQGDCGRIVSAMKRIMPDRAGYFDEVWRRISRGMTREVSELCKIQGMTKGMARWLLSVGVESVSDVVELGPDLISELDDEGAERFQQVIDFARRGI